MLYLIICFKFILLNYYMPHVIATSKVDKPFVEVVTGANDETEEYYVVSDNNIQENNENDEYDEESVGSIDRSKPHQLIPPYADVPVDYKRVCIYPNWSVLRDSNMAKIFPEDIDPHMCKLCLFSSIFLISLMIFYLNSIFWLKKGTHIHYAYANIDVRTFQLSPSQFQDFNSGDHGAVIPPNND